MARKNKKEKKNMFGIFGSVSSAGSIVSAHNICHWLCLVAVAALSVFGIAVSSTVLMFLEEYTMLFWTMGVGFLAMSLFLYARNPKCISKNLIIFNTGLLVIGIPFLSQFNLFFWLFGGTIVVLISGLYLKERFLVGRK